ncbi:hypothetical protein [Microbacterium sp. SORGH_AS_0888]|uniref:hypothetical protein n=1 Tax=Microbacterium sp. SORGH_AS_0888 TaxID=3041791 RepID=UPI00278900CD|nr:hypothetical protein [Microbacterium sp. SORGH_AS_0888]MDQ1128590.1 hypothetical protein [Microbacterium sp. SORGH_AS_0888]
MTETTDPLTAGTPEILRRVGPPAAPWPAGLVRTAAGPALLVELDELSDAAFGPPAEHVARPSEIFRTVEGHLALLPALSRPLAPAPRSAGAAVTLAVSIVRGLGEAGGHACGQWWLAEGGAPVFVPVRDGEDAASAAVELLRALAGPGASDVFAELAEELARPEELDAVATAQWEERLFRTATPAPITAASADQDAMRRRRRTEPAPGLAVPVLRALDGPLASAVSDAATSLRRTAARLRGRRAPVVIAAGAIALVVIAVGLGWPEPGDPPSAAVPTDGTYSAPPSATTATGDTGGLPEPVDAARELSERLSSCGDARCRAEVLEDPATVVPEDGAATAPQATLTLVDDLGGIAVVRAEAEGRPSQLIVMVARNDSWLVRDVYDAADQP